METSDVSAEIQLWAWLQEVPRTWCNTAVPGWSNPAQRPHSEAVTDEAHLSPGCLVAEAQKVWFVQALAPEACTSRDVHPQDESWEFSTALLHNDLQRVDTQKKRKESKAKMGKMAEPTVLRLGVWHSGSCGSFHLLSVLFELTCTQLRMQGALLFFKALIPLCSSSVTFLKEQLYEHNHEYYHPGDLPDSSSLIVP